MLDNASKVARWQMVGLSSRYNLADAYARQDFTFNQKEILNNLSHVFWEAATTTYQSLTGKFTSAFFDLVGQHSFKAFSKALFHHSASFSIEVIANYLRLNQMTVGLIHPTLKVIADILTRHNVHLLAIEEDLLTQPEYLPPNIDALFIVIPNNPTGFELDRKGFQELALACQRANILLIVDFCLRFFASESNWDQYEILKESGVNFITLEDTGKTWPALDLKLSFLMASNSVYPVLQSISDDMLLNVSPFVVTLITQFVLSSEKTPFHERPEAIVERNKLRLQATLSELPVKLLAPQSKLSVAWIQLPGEWNSLDLCLWLAEFYDLTIMPGIYFYWSQPKNGYSWVRIALLRPVQLFEEAMINLYKGMQAYQVNHQENFD